MIPTGNDSNSQAFEAPCGEKGVVYQVTRGLGED
jgi:hypothetical protein